MESETPGLAPHVQPETVGGAAETGQHPSAPQTTLPPQPLARLSRLVNQQPVSSPPVTPATDSAVVHTTSNLTPPNDSHGRAIEQNLHHRQSSEVSFTWPVKLIIFPPGSSAAGGEVSIVLQNENGPCSLIALANILLLTRKIALRPNTKHVSYDELAERIADHLLQRLSAMPDAQHRLGLTGALEVLPKTRFGLDVNVRFASTDGFADDGTGALALFELAGAKLLHGWVADSADHETWDALVTQTGDYDTAVARLVEADVLVSDVVLPSAAAQAKPMFPETWTDAQRRLVSTALTIRRFLESSASQLTYVGLFDLAATLHPGTLAALFRNAHFTVIYRRPSKSGEPTLFHLVTDSTLARAPQVVWEGLTDVDGAAAEFYDAQLTPASFDGDFVTTSSPTQARQNDDASSQRYPDLDLAEIARQNEPDALLAARMQQAEYDRHAQRQQQIAEERQRRASAAPPVQPIPVPKAQMDTRQTAGQVSRKKSKDKCTLM